MTDYGDMCKDLREMRREIAKQARLLGIGGTREAALMAKVDAITQERDEARAALRMIADGDLYNADGMRTIACKALAATEAARKFCGVGELERAGYIPAGSADEREAKP